IRLERGNAFADVTRGRVEFVGEERARDPDLDHAAEADLAEPGNGGGPHAEQRVVTGRAGVEERRAAVAEEKGGSVRRAARRRVRADGPRRRTAAAPAPRCGRCREGARRWRR